MASQTFHSKCQEKKCSNRKKIGVFSEILTNSSEIFDDATNMARCLGMMYNFDHFHTQRTHTHMHSAHTHNTRYVRE